MHHGGGRLPLNPKNWEARAYMTTYEKAMLVVAILRLIIDAVALFTQKRK